MASSTDVQAQRAPELDGLLAEGVRDGVFPGAVAAVGRLAERGSVRVLARAGRLAPGELEVALATPYDLASLTKPFVAVSALRLAQKRQVDLSAPVSRHLPELEGTQGGESSLTALLSHRAGLSAWAGLYREHSALPGSAEMKRFMLHAAATRVDPSAASGAIDSVYSDLGYIVAGEALTRAAGMALDQLVRREVTGPLGIDQHVFYAARLREAEREDLRARAAPTEACGYRGRIVRGEVHDENAYAFGGIAGHAGLFGNANAVLSFGLAVLDALEGRSRWLDLALLHWALAPRGGGYVVGWDTKSPEDSSAGQLFSERSFGHLGFTGTSLWCDPTRRLCAVLLSNRVHPTRDNVAIRVFRPRFHDLVASLDW